MGSAYGTAVLFTYNTICYSKLKKILKYHLSKHCITSNQALFIDLCYQMHNFDATPILKS